MIGTDLTEDEAVDLRDTYAQGLERNGTDLQQYERIQTFLQRSPRSANENQSVDEAETDRVDKDPEEEKASDQEDDFSPGGKERVSKTSKTLQKNNIPVGDRVYTSTTNAERQEFADKLLRR